jgi:hypothetical protein
MKRCQLFVYLLLAMMGLLSQPIALVADEPLKMKIELLHGQNGPKRSPIVYPGERLQFSIALSGLRLSEEKKVKARGNGSLRTETDELISEVGEMVLDGQLLIGSGRLVCLAGVNLPKEQEPGPINFVFTVRDENSGQDVKQEFPIKVRQTPEGVYPLMAGYWIGGKYGGTPEGVPASGKFTPGDNVLLGFVANGLGKTKRLDSVIEMFKKGEKKPVNRIPFSTEVPLAYRSHDAVPMHFPLAASEPFDGYVRVTLTDDAGHSNSVELPFQVTEALSSEESTEVAERPGDKSQPTKNE